MIALEAKVKFNGGGHFNHEFYWDSLCPAKDSHLPEKDSILHQRIVQEFGSMEKFITIFSAQTSGIMGSGWGWLVYNKKTGVLNLRMTKDQDLISDHARNSSPILNVDIWEHAYYLDYKNARP